MSLPIEVVYRAVIPPHATSKLPTPITCKLDLQRRSGIDLVVTLPHERLPLLTRPSRRFLLFYIPVPRSRRRFLRLLLSSTAFSFSAAFSSSAAFFSTVPFFPPPPSLPPPHPLPHLSLRPPPFTMDQLDASYPHACSTPSSVSQVLDGGNTASLAGSLVKPWDVVIGIFGAYTSSPRR